MLLTSNQATPVQNGFMSNVSASIVAIYHQSIFVLIVRALHQPYGADEYESLRDPIQI